LAYQFDSEIPWVEEASTEEMRRSVEALYRAHRLTAVMRDVDALLTLLAEESRKVARGEACSLLLYDEANEELYFKVALGESGIEETLQEEIRLKVGQGIAGVAAQSRTSIIVENAQSDPRFFRPADDATNFSTRNVLAVPMMDRGKLIGVLEILNKRNGEAFSWLDLHVTEMFSSLAATSITNARLLEEHVQSERMAAIGLAVTGLSHYTKNIVTGLNSSADLIEMGIRKKEMGIIERTWPIFQRSSKRISIFVQDMLSYSKPRKPHIAPCNVAALINDADETFRAMFIRKQTEVRIDTSGCTCEHPMEYQGIYSCLLNLLTNAADAVPDDGGWVEITARTLPNTALEMRVGDNGPGIPEESHDKIFDPFYSTKGQHGTGLGLAVTKKIVEEHGGTIEVTEHPNGGGALFIITLPGPKISNPNEDIFGK